MCIAIYSPIGTKVPSKAFLQNSWDSNPDGAGFAYNTKDGRVRILKGFMTWESFWSAFEKFSGKEDFENRGVLMHFRIATHGGTNQECTHPFPLCADIGIMQKTDIITDYAVEHNGIISLTSTEASKPGVKASDTMKFIELYMSKLATNKGWFENESNWELIYDLAGSKIACLAGDGRIMSTAGFTKDEDGNYYSNTSYKTSYYYGNYSSKYYDRYAYDDDDGYYVNKTYENYDDPIALKLFGNHQYYGGDGEMEYFRFGYVNRKTLKYEKYNETDLTSHEGKMAIAEEKKVNEEYIPKLKESMKKSGKNLPVPYADDDDDDDYDDDEIILPDDEFIPDGEYWGTIPELAEVYQGYTPMMLLGPTYYCISQTDNDAEYTWDGKFPMAVDVNGKMYFLDGAPEFDENIINNSIIFVDDVTVHSIYNYDTESNMPYEFKPNVQIETSNIYY